MQEELLSSDSLEKLAKLPCAVVRASAGSLLGPIENEMASLVAANQLAVGNLQQVPSLERRRGLALRRAPTAALASACARSAGIDQSGTHLVTTQKGTSGNRAGASQRKGLLVPNNCALFRAMIAKMNLAPEPQPMHLMLLLSEPE